MALPFKPKKLLLEPHSTCPRCGAAINELDAVDGQHRQLLKPENSLALFCLNCNAKYQKAVEAGKAPASTMAPPILILYYRGAPKYYCAYDPEVTSNVPGTCPLCGRQLVPVNQAIYL